MPDKSIFFFSLIGFSQGFHHYLRKKNHLQAIIALMSLWRGFAAETGKGKLTKLPVLWEQNARPETRDPDVFPVGGKKK